MGLKPARTERTRVVSRPVGDPPRVGVATAAGRPEGRPAAAPPDPTTTGEAAQATAHAPPTSHTVPLSRRPSPISARNRSRAPARGPAIETLVASPVAHHEGAAIGTAGGIGLRAERDGRLYRCRGRGES